ncbi:MAG TPA: beta-L-arabinofuranosidase domain-containing protein [Candidatus Limnocylindrales bacterium]|nr:beta-L-arabinofuranosidase domain-containing protein [Candidatus Limnocylindrales bacterium]
MTGGFWADRLVRNRERTIPVGFEQLRRAGNLHNLRLAAGAAAAGDAYRALGIMFDKPFPFLDSDVYKWLEGAGWELGRSPEPKLAAMADEAIALVEAAQRPDGYLNTFVQVLTPGSEYADLAWGHELYCYGHLVQAAVAWHRALGDDRLLLVAERAVASVETAIGPGRREAIDGHPEIEMALVELYRITTERRYLELASAFIDRRGRGILGTGRFGSAYWQDHLPVREAPSVAGHAVRQLYLDAGAVDVAVEMGDEGLLAAVHRRWRDMVATKMYLTGALGSRHRDEAFGDPFELPPDLAYAETCAAIASVMLAWRLLLATGDPDCADVIERTIYNGVLPALSADGTAFFYVNPLQRRTHRAWAEPGEGERRSWYACACCPPNLMRMLSSWQQYLATTDDGGVQIHQYATVEISAPAADGDVRLAVETDYPWDGSVRVTVVVTPDQPWELALRVPGWCESATLRIASGTETVATSSAAAGGDRMLRETRTWRPGDAVELVLDMPVRITTPDPRVDALRGTVALERGPLVYCVETADLPPGAELEAVSLPGDASTSTMPRPDLGPSVVGLTASGSIAGSAGEIRAVPYFAWANREVAAMRVWMPRSPAPEA